MVHLVDLVPLRTGVGHAMAPEGEEVIQGKGKGHLQDKLVVIRKLIKPYSNHPDIGEVDGHRQDQQLSED